MVTHSFSVDWKGELAERGQDTCLPSGRIAFGSSKVPWLDPFAGAARELVLLATTVREIDRLVKRSAANAASTWGRSLKLTLPVGNVRRWKRVEPLLQELLHWLTDDAWQFCFVDDHNAPMVQAQMFAEHPLKGADAVALFSGGLDSVAGADVWLSGGGNGYLFTVSGDNVHAKHSGAAARVLQALYPDRTSLLAITHQLRGACPVENSQRTRGFFFFAVAAAIAHEVKVRRIITFEAGVGALNLPMNTSQTGAENTHAMHPRTLLLVQSILRQLFDSDFTVEAPFLFRTKGEVCLASGHIDALARISYSCDVPQGRKPRPLQHCGTCTSCLFRRAALFSAMGNKDPTDYSSPISNDCSSYEVEAFHEQSRRFAAWRNFGELINYSPMARHAVRFAAQSQGLQECGERELVKLFNRHGEEVMHLMRKLVPSRRTVRSVQQPTGEVHHAIG